MRRLAFTSALTLGALLGATGALADPGGETAVGERGWMLLPMSVTTETLPSDFAGPPWAGVKRLSLRDQPRDAALLARLFAEPSLATLEALDLSGVPVHADAADALARATLPALRELVLSSTALGDEGAEALAKAALPALEDLSLDQAGVGAEGGCALARADWPRLKRLSIAGASDLWETGPRPFLGSRGFAALVGAPGLAGLEELRAPLNAVGSKGAKALARAGQLSQLKVLDLRANDIDDPGAEALLDAPQLAGLARLDLADNPISDAVKARFRERFGERVRL